jgi:PiT family inorganic phosphate transporter
VITETAILIVAMVVIILSLTFAFTNGFHDASAIIATLIACGAASPRGAVLLASSMVMLGALVGGSAVAFTIEGLIQMSIGHDLIVLLAAAVLGGIIWNLITWKYGLPSSSTQALVGGMLGATIAAGGFGGIFWGFDELVGPNHMLAGVTKVVIFLIWSILMGLSVGYLFQRFASGLLRNAKKSVNKSIKRMQWFTAGLLAFSYGTNDSQKQMGLIVLILISGGYVTTMDIPLWVRILCGAVMLLGVLGGGWRIVKTIGRRIYPIEPIHSLDSQLASTSSILLSTWAGAPVSSTQIVATSVMGVGAADNPKMLQWSVGKDMVIAWLLTIPAAMALSMVLYFPLNWLLSGA